MSAEKVEGGTKILRFGNGVFTVEVYGPTDEVCQSRLGELLSGKLGHLCGEFTNPEISVNILAERHEALTRRTAELEAVREHYANEESWDFHARETDGCPSDEKDLYVGGDGHGYEVAQAAKQEVEG